MENDAATLYCPNEQCQAANPLNHKFCQQCSTALPKRYLRVMGEGLYLAGPGDLLAQRYLVINHSVVLDTAPGMVPQTPELDNFPVIKPYLRLIPYRLHVPQLYGVVSLPHRQGNEEIFLLEKAPLQADSTGLQVQWYPELTAAWHEATSLRQLNWLWQIANLWEPFLSEGVASSLFTSELLRTEGSLIRLLELRLDASLDASIAPNLSQLGEFWQQLQPGAKPAISEFIQQISHALIEQVITSAEQLITVLDQGLADLGRSQTPTIKIFTKTDTGPVRQRNEDACYPPSDTLISKPPQPTALAIVCDGIGGHEGGNVASNLAIDTIQQRIEQLTTVTPDHIDSALRLNNLESAVSAANDKISQRNDSEGRHGRQRMGTTLVMALSIANEMYITHVGDSRAYWITRHGCYQVTLDDDVASREVRLGYAIYREATQQGGSGSLVQALGMSSSNSLHPTAQRFILDDQGVFLLTSDGLSDFDRIEDNWETEILPIITAQADLKTIGDRLIEIANTKNGHDNVTIALVHYQVQYAEPQLTLEAVIPERNANQTVDLSARTAPRTVMPSHSHEKTQAVSQTPSQQRKIPQVPLGIIAPGIVLLAAGAMGYVLMDRLSSSSQVESNPSATSTVSPTATGTSKPRTLENLEVGWVIKTKQEITKEKAQESFPKDSILEVTKKPFSGDNGERVVELRLCSKNGKTISDTAQESKTLNIPLSELKNKVDILQDNQPNLCKTAPSTSTASPKPTSTSDSNGPPTKSQ